MSFFNDVIQKIFYKNRQKQQVAVNEKLVFDDAFKQKYNEWLLAEEDKLLEDLLRSVHLKEKDLETLFSVQVLQMPAAKGFAIIQNDQLKNEDLAFLLFHFKEVIQNEGYRISRSGRKLSEKEHFVETKEGFYLKPDLRGSIDAQGKYNQLFGNITLELNYVDNNPSYLKVIVAWYNDYQYTKVLDYIDLLPKLFKRITSSEQS